MADITILSPQSPARGMLSYPDPASLPEGFWSRLQNLRLDKANFTVRKGCSDLQPTWGGDSPTSCLGAWSGALNGTHYLLCAQVVSGGTRIYASTNGTSWSEVSKGSGVAYPNTRLTSTTAEVSFTVARDPYTSRDVVVISNGVDSPRIYDPLDTDGTSSNFTSHMTIAAADSSAVQQVLMAGRGSFEIYDNASLAKVLDSGDDFYTNNAAIIDYLNVDTTVGTNATLYYSHNTDPQDFSGRQLAILVSEIVGSEDLWAEFFGNVEIHVSEGTCATNPPTEVELQALTWTKVYDHDDVATYPISAIEHDQGSVPGHWVLIDMRAVPTASRNAVRHLKFVWTGSQPSVDKTWHFRCIACLGDVPGNARHVVTFYNSKSRSESPSTLFPAAIGATLDQLGGGTGWVGSDEPIRLPQSSSIYVDYQLRLTKYAQAVADAGVDSIRLYRRDSGDSEYRLASQSVAATVNYGTGVWSASNGSFSSSVTLTDNVATESLNYTTTAPDSRHLCIPIGSVSASANSRLWIGSSSALKISELDQPFRFRDATKFLLDTDGNSTSEVDPRSPVRHNLQGESIYAVTSLDVGDTANSAANQQVYVHSDSSLYSISGFDATSLSRRSRLAPIGAIGFGAVTLGRQTLYWVDPDSQLWTMRGGSISPLTKFKMSELSNAPASRRSQVRLIWKDGAMMTAYTPSAGLANTELMVYDEALGAFYVDALPSSRSAERLIIWRDSTNRRTLCFGSSGQLTEHAQESSLGTGLESTVSVAFTTAEINKDLSKGFTIKSISVLADDSNSTTLTATADWAPYSSTSTFTISLDASTGDAWKRSDQPPTVTFDANDRGGSGVGAQLVFTASLASGKRIRAITLETEERSNRRSERG